MLFLLPLLIAGVQFNVARIRRNQCADMLAASLPAAYMAISMEQFSLGIIEIDRENVTYLIENLLLQNMRQANSTANLQRVSTEITTILRSESEDHWLSGARPALMPVISATATWRFNDQNEITVNDRIEMVLD
jgi:hypothetical protein